MLTLLLASALLLSAVQGQPTPLTPPNGQVGECDILWTPDTTGKWTQTNIELMTGSNQAMMHITTVATVDTTANAASNFTYPCPNVIPTANIYWYQFSHAAEPANLIWTTRFAITGANGQITAPANPLQPDGQAPPWGIGNLVDPSLAKPAPSYVQGETSATGGNSTTPSASVNASVSVSVISITTASTSMPISTSSMSMTTVSVPVVKTITPTSTAPASTTSASTSGALSTRTTGAIGVLIAIALMFGVGT
ncbi:hypothetical protein FRB93_000051 [Tulasnella sp. JGI-2019a]|nr:hypothetical protein FRB93_000051 [Tulasnella sp. JGI-2019a]